MYNLLWILILRNWCSSLQLACTHSQFSSVPFPPSPLSTPPPPPFYPLLSHPSPPLCPMLPKPFPPRSDTPPQSNPNQSGHDSTLIKQVELTLRTVHDCGLKSLIKMQSMNLQLVSTLSPLLFMTFWCIKTCQTCWA